MFVIPGLGRMKTGGLLWVWGQPGLQGETLSQRNSPAPQNSTSTTAVVGGGAGHVKHQNVHTQSCKRSNNLEKKSIVSQLSQSSFSLKILHLFINKFDLVIFWFSIKITASKLVIRISSILFQSKYLGSSGNYSSTHRISFIWKNYGISLQNINFIKI